MVDKTAKSPEEAKAGAEKSQAKGIKDRSDLASDFGGANPKYYLGLDSYGRVRQLNEVVGGATVQRFLIVDSNGIDYQVINADQIVQQVRKYFKNNKEGLRKTLYDLGYMSEREYTTRSEQALTTSILQVANEYTVDTVDSYRIDNKTKFSPFTSWLKNIPAAGRDEGGSQYPLRDINMMDRDVVEAIVRDVYSRETDMSPNEQDAFIQEKTDMYMNQIKEGTLTTLKKEGGVNVRKSTKPFSEAQVRAEVPKFIEQELPGVTDYKKSFDFLAFLDDMGAKVG
jgi:hypothetical protein